MAYASVVEGWHFLSPHVQDNPSFWQYSSITVLVNGKFTNHRSFSSSQYIFSLLPNITALISATFSAKYWWQISSFCVGCLLSTVVIIGHFSMLIIHLRSRFTFSLYLVHKNVSITVIWLLLKYLLGQETNWRPHICQQLSMENVAGSWVFMT